MINGAHIVIHSKDPQADRTFLRDVLGFRYVDAGDGWLIFALPEAEVAVHPADRNDVQQLFLMCDDLDAEVARLAGADVACGEIESAGWGRFTNIALPGGGRLGLYQPRHSRP